FDVVDAVDIEEVIFVVVGDQTLHLSRIQAAVGLRDVDDWQIKTWEDVYLHTAQRQPAARNEGNHRNHHCDRPAQSEFDRIHKNYYACALAQMKGKGECITSTLNLQIANNFQSSNKKGLLARLCRLSLRERARPHLVRGVRGDP